MKNHGNTGYPPKPILECRQRGVALIITLLLLLVITILGVTAIQSSMLEEKMTSNLRDRSLAFHAAESALRAGESSIASLPSTPACANGFYPASDVDCDGAVETTPLWQAVDWRANSTQVVHYDNASIFQHVSTNPEYIIERITISGGTLESGGATPTQTYYRITARGTGSSANAVVFLQTIFK